MGLARLWESDLFVGLVLVVSPTYVPNYQNFLTFYLQTRISASKFSVNLKQKHGLIQMLSWQFLCTIMLGISCVIAIYVDAIISYVMMF